MTQEQLSTLETAARVYGPVNRELEYLEKSAALRGAADELGLILCRLLRRQQLNQYEVKEAAGHASATAACYLIILQQIVLMCGVEHMDVTQDIDTIMRAEVSALQRKVTHKIQEERSYE